MESIKKRKKYRKRKIFGIFLIIIIAIILVTSNYIWNIEIKIEDNEIIEGIEQDLIEAGLTVGKNKNEIKAKEVIQKIRLKRNDISWIGIELKGTNAIVKIVKPEEAPKIIDENDYTNIVANKSGIITKIIAQNGTAKVEVGDTVGVGTVLIEGIMEGKYTDKRYVHSIGEIEAKVWYSKTQKVYYTNEEKEYTKNEENKYSVKINKFEINLYKTLSNFKIYDTIRKEKKVKIFSNLYLPISLIKITNKEQINVKKEYGLEEAKEIAIKKSREALNNEIGENNILRRSNKHNRTSRLRRGNCYI